MREGKSASATSFFFIYVQGNTTVLRSKENRERIIASTLHILLTVCEPCNAVSKYGLWLCNLICLSGPVMVFKCYVNITTVTGGERK